MNKITYRKLVESFGKKIINENFENNSAAKYYLENDTIRDMDDESISHLISCIDIMPETLLKITEQCSGIEIDLSEDNYGGYVNDMCKHINSCKNLFKDSFSINENGVDASDESKKYFVDGVKSISEQYKLNESEQISTDIHDIIYGKLSEDEISTLHNMIYDDSNFNYEPRFRDDVYEHTQNNDNSQVTNIVKNTLTKDKKISDVVENVGLLEAARIQKKNISIIPNNSGITKITKLTEGYSIDNHRIKNVKKLESSINKLTESIPSKYIDYINKEIMSGEKAGIIDRISTKISKEMGYVDKDDNLINESKYKQIISDVFKYYKKLTESAKTIELTVSDKEKFNNILKKQTDNYSSDGDKFILYYNNPKEKEYFKEYINQYEKNGGKITKLTESVEQSTYKKVEEILQDLYPNQKSIVNSYKVDKNKLYDEIKSETQYLSRKDIISAVDDYVTLNEAIELVHVYDDENKKKLFETGSIGDDNGKVKKKIDGIEHTFVRFDNNTTKWIPSDRIKLTESISDDIKKWIFKYDGVRIKSKYKDMLAYEFLNDKMFEVAKKEIDEMGAKTPIIDSINNIIYFHKSSIIL